MDSTCKTKAAFKKRVAEGDFQLGSPNHNGVWSVYGPHDSWHCLVILVAGIVDRIQPPWGRKKMVTGGRVRYKTPNPWLSPNEKARMKRCV